MRTSGPNRRSYRGPPLMWLPLLLGWSSNIRGVVSHQGDIYAKMQDLVPDFGIMGTCSTEGSHNRGTTVHWDPECSTLLLYQWGGYVTLNLKASTRLELSLLHRLANPSCIWDPLAHPMHPGLACATCCKQKLSTQGECESLAKAMSSSCCGIYMPLWCIYETMWDNSSHKPSGNNPKWKCFAHLFPHAGHTHGFKQQTQEKKYNNSSIKLVPSWGGSERLDNLLPRWLEVHIRRKL